MDTKVISGQPSWTFASDKVEAAVTQLGGQLGPVTFTLPDGRKISPYSVAPWAEENLPETMPAILRALRGDFFCAPFGGNDSPFGDEQHPAHGEVANEPWKFETLTSLNIGKSRVMLHLSLATRVREGRVDKYIQLREGESAVYSQHVLSKASGPMNLGHHAMLKFPETEGSGRISTSALLYGQVAPQTFEEPEKGGYSSLKTGATFTSLESVPAADGGTVDLTRYPARGGFEDLVMFVHESTPDFAWLAVAFPEQGYVWYTLKDPRTLRSTVFWISNGGRHYEPWSKRHKLVMGLEDVTSYFHYGLAESARNNEVNALGYPTALVLDSDTPLTINYIQGVTAIPADFDKVASIEQDTDGQITLVSANGIRVTTPVDTSFLYKTG
ncbi:MAG: hypothetical protein ACAI35_14205 [Candidatus Methylacidiphilales bacterium]|nr:hypothetical protein [Candidatus Methylacidiphilales bacterium]